MTKKTYQYKPLNIGRLLVWGGFALLLVLMPQIFTGNLALTMLSQIGYMIIICLSYNMLLGQGGMLSFGYAVYVGFGAFAVAHTLNRVGAGTLGIPVSLVPFVGGLAGAIVACILGWVSTKKAHTTFAMITMGVGELVFAMTYIFPEVFGGESGISTNRVVGEPFKIFETSINFGPQIQLYYLIAAYCFVCTVLMFMFTATPLGRMLNAVRDNPERVEFVGYNTQLVRYIAFILSGFFAGIGGGLFALNFELVQGSAMSGITSAGYLLFTYIGGALLFFGPIIGAVLSVLVGILLSEITKAWALYLGIVFVLMVMFAPGGLSAIIMLNIRVALFKRFKRLVLPYITLLITTPVLVLGAAALVEMLYHKQINAEMNPEFKFLGIQLNVFSAQHWIVAAAITLIGAVAFEFSRRYFKGKWDSAEEEIQHIIRMRESA